MKEQSNTLTKEKVSEQFQQKLGFSAKDAREHLEILLEQIKNELEKGNSVKISGFGKWTIRSKSPRPGRNPHTGGKIKISARNVITFHPSDKLRSLINESKKN